MALKAYNYIACYRVKILHHNLLGSDWGANSYRPISLNPLPFISFPFSLFAIKNLEQASLRTAEVFPVVASLPAKNHVCEQGAAKQFSWRKTFVESF